MVGCGWCWLCFFLSFFFFLLSGGGFDECGCGWIGSWVVALSVMGFDRGYGCWVCLVMGSGDVLAMVFFFFP